MKLKLFGLLVLCGITAAACKKGTDDTSVGGGGSGTTSSTKTSCGTKMTATSSTGSKMTSTGTSATGTCDDIGVCGGDGMDPTSGCIECSILGDSTTATDGGTCQGAYVAAYGMDGMCTGGTGTPGACAFVDCETTCDANGNNKFDTQAEIDCFCTNDQMGANSMCSPLAMQTDTGTCLGALNADMAGLQAEGTFENCVFTTTCPGSCPQG